MRPSRYPQAPSVSSFRLEGRWPGRMGEDTGTVRLHPCPSRKEGWSGWSRRNEPVRFQSTPAQPAGGSGAQGGNASSMAGPSAAVKTAFDKLHTDIQAIHDKSEVTPKLLAAVRTDFEAIQKA